MLRNLTKVALMCLWSVAAPAMAANYTFCFIDWIPYGQATGAKKAKGIEQYIGMSFKAFKKQYGLK